jgi:putative ABC transport system permease protein
MELALALVLVIAAGLAVGSFARLSATPLGFRADRLLTMRLDFPPFQFKSPASYVAYCDRILAAVRQTPGVESASASVFIPLGGGHGETMFRIEGQKGQGRHQAANWNSVATGYFQTFGIPIVAGRDFNAGDRAGSMPVAIVNQAFAREYFGNESPLGRRISIPTSDDKKPSVWSEIVGEVGDTHDIGLAKKAGPAIYQPYPQSDLAQGFTSGIFLLARSKADPMSLARTIQDQIWSVDKDQPVTNLKTMTQILATSYAEPRSQSLLLAIFGALGLVLALVGIYGVISYSVGQRTREIGLRMALGAQTKDVLRLVVAQGTKLVLAGVAIGLAASFAATRLMRGLLYGISATDPLTFAGVSALLILAGLAACYIPARRATRVDPMSALRNE